LIKVSFTKTVELFGGRIGLTDKQAQLRRSRLKAIDKGVYEITGPVEFKRGEAIGLETVDPYLRTILAPDSLSAVAAMDRAELEASEAAKPKNAQAKANPES